MKTWVSFRPERAELGKRVLSYPDHRGQSVEGIIREVTVSSLIVEYRRYGIVTLNRCGKLIEVCDTSADINLIEQYIKLREIPSASFVVTKCNGM